MYTEHCKTLMKEFEDTSKWEDIPCLRTERINIVKAIYRLSAICITIPLAFFIEIEQKSQNLAWTARTVLRKKIKTGRILLADLKQYYKATVIKTVLAYTQTHRSVEQTRDPRNEPRHVWSTNLWQKSQDYTRGKRIVSSVHAVGKIGQPHAKEWNWITILNYTQKLTQNGIKTWMLEWKL